MTTSTATGVETRGALLGTRLAVWGLGLLALTEALRHPAAVVARGSFDAVAVDRWFGTAIPILRSTHLVGLALCVASSLLLLRASGFKLPAGLAAGLTGLTAAASALELIRVLLLPALGVQLAVWVETIGLVALLAAALVAVRQVDRRGPLGPLAWATVLLTVGLVIDAYRALGDVTGFDRYLTVANAAWIARTTGLLVASVAASRARRALARFAHAVPAAADEPANASADDVDTWPKARGWGYLRLRAGFELVLMVGTLAVFIGTWLVVGCWRLFKDLADDLEGELARLSAGALRTPGRGRP